jgi:hypothetical protein
MKPCVLVSASGGQGAALDPAPLRTPAERTSPATSPRRARGQPDRAAPLKGASRPPADP